MNNKRNKKQRQNKKSFRKNRIVNLIWFTFGSIVALSFLFLILIYNGIIGYMPSIEDITNPNDKYATLIYSADGKEMGRYYSGSENRIYTDLEEIPQHMIDALVATEDVRFYDHSGIDARALLRAIVKRGLLGQESAGGASTLTQQLAKQVYTQQPAENSFKRALQKPVEWMIALKLERYYSKDEIIKMYLNQFDFLYNAVGVKSAAHVYFGKKPADLTIEEAATLVGMVKNPSYFNPIRHNERTCKRRNVVLRQMVVAGFLSQEEYDKLKEKPLIVDYHRPHGHNDGIAPYFREELRRYLSAKKPDRDNYSAWNIKQFRSDSTAWADDPLYGWCEKNDYDIYKDGLRIHTTIDSRMQEYAEDALEGQLKKLQKEFGTTRYKNKYSLYSTHGHLTKQNIDKFINTSIRHSDRYRIGKNAGKSHEEIMQEFNTPVEMTLFSYNGPQDITMTPYDSVLYYKQFLRAGFMAMDANNGHIKAYVGGVDFKRFKYDMVSIGRRQIGSTAKPYLYAAAIEDLDLDPSDEVNCSSPTWKPKGSSEGTMSLKTALTKSHNGASAWLIHSIGTQRMIDQMGAQGLIKNNIEKTTTIALGSCEVPLREMCVGYSAFANQGFSSASMMVTHITDRTGNIIASFSPHSSHAMTKNGYARMLETLQSVVKNGTGRSMNTLNASMGGKTGTTDYNADGWFMGFTPKLVFGAWVGGEVAYIHLNRTGAYTALPICKSFMSKVYNNKKLPYKRTDKFTIDEDAIVYKNPIVTENEDSIATTIEDVYD